MPYFLVTHTALIEADNETTAAEIVQSKIARGDQVAFDVRADEQHIVKIIVEAGPREDAHPRPTPQETGNRTSVAAVDTVAVVREAGTPWRASGNLPQAALYCAAVAVVAAFFLMGHFLR
jgi:hypothetical protein